jgi:hypothetical protein
MTDIDALHAKMRQLVNDVGKLTPGHTPRGVIFALAYVIGKIIADGPLDEVGRQRMRAQAIEAIDLAISGRLEERRRH